VRAILAEPLRIHGRRHEDLDARAAELLDRVKLPSSAMDKYPHQFSGGERQRLAIARAMALDPAVLICDEPVSSLDATIRGDIVRLLMELQVAYGLSMIFVGHDLDICRAISHRIAVMYDGEIVEVSDTERFFMGPAHPYSQSLLAADMSARPSQWSRPSR
jgi:ABC-type glutathione transport system ATPase component